MESSLTRGVRISLSLAALALVALSGALPLGVPHPIASTAIAGDLKPTAQFPRLEQASPGSLDDNLPRAPFRTLPLEGPPTGADLSFDNNTRPYPALQSLAANLSDSPERIFEFVRNSIAFDPYNGSMKGAYQTFSTGAGNDVDQASLLISLLRISGIPAQYVSGQLDLPISETLNWLGFSVSGNITVAMGNEGARVLSQAGIQYQWGYSQGSNPSSIVYHIDQTWAEAYINGSWVMMDPSFKLNDFSTPLNSTRLFYGFNASSAAALNESNIQYYESFVGTSFTDYLQFDPTLRLGTVLASTQIVNATGFQLPSPYSVQWIGPALPSSLDWRLQVTFPDYQPSTGAFVDSPGYTIYLPTAVLGAAPLIVFSLPNATTLSGLQGVPGGIFNANIAPATIEMRPVLSFNGTDLLQGDSIPIGLEMPIDVASIVNSSVIATGTPHLSVGGAGAIVVSLGHDYAAFDNERDSRLSAYVQTASAFASGQQVSYDSLVGGQFSIIGMSYFAILNAFSAPIERANDIVSLADVGVAFVSSQVDLIYNGQGVAIRAVFGGDTIDVQINPNSPADQLDQNQAVGDSFNLLLGGFGSYMEGVTMAAAFATAPISTISIFEYAAELGIPVALFSPENFSLDFPRLGLPSWVQSEVAPYIAEGLSVAIPSQLVTPSPVRFTLSNSSIRPGNLSTWTGTGFIVYDPDTMNAGYIISGVLTSASGSSLPVTVNGGTAGTDSVDNSTLEFEGSYSGMTCPGECYITAPGVEPLAIPLADDQASLANQPAIVALLLASQTALATLLTGIVLGILTTVVVLEFDAILLETLILAPIVVPFLLSFSAADIVGLLGDIQECAESVVSLSDPTACAKAALEVLQHAGEAGAAPFQMSSLSAGQYNPGLYLASSFGEASGYDQQGPSIPYTQYYDGNQSNPQELYLYSIPPGLYGLYVSNPSSSSSAYFGSLQWTSGLTNESASFMTPDVPAGWTERAPVEASYTSTGTSFTVGSFEPADFINLQPAEATAAGTESSITGSLVGPDNASPMGHQAVELSYRLVASVSASWTPIGNSTTASDGTFEADWTPPSVGVYSIRAIYVGNATRSPSTAQQTVTVLGPVLVTVQSIGNQPISGLQVFLDGPGYALNETTNTSGQAKFLVDAGTYELGVPSAIPVGSGSRLGFVSWVLGPRSANWTLVVTSRVEATALFVSEFAITTRYDDGGFGTLLSPPTMSFASAEAGINASILSQDTIAWIDANTNVSFRAHSDLIHTFKMWVRNGTSVSTQPTYTFVASGPATFVAQFTTETFEVGVAGIVGVAVLIALVTWAAGGSRRKRPPTSPSRESPT